MLEIVTDCSAYQSKMEAISLESDRMTFAKVRYAMRRRSLLSQRFGRRAKVTRTAVLDMRENEEPIMLNVRRFALATEPKQ